MNRMVFCDFDGTITAEDTFVSVLQHFTPEQSDIILPKLYRKEMTIKQGIRTLLEILPSSIYPDMVEFTRPKAIRPGFAEFLDFLDQQNIPFVVISGGLSGIIEAVLEPFLHQIKVIHAIDVDISGPHIKLQSAHEGDTEMVAKADILATYQNTYDLDESIVIGDGITDWNLALAASMVFARPPLTAHMEEHGRPYLEWNNFTDIHQYLAQYLSK
ncbi:MAG: HAD-IB family phosphatase [Cyanobacteria bacterium P01_F01_bin.150]